MRGSESFIAVDWGTTNRRAYLLDSSGRCVDEMEDGKGVLSVERSEFPAAVAEIRDRLGDLPLLLAGMAGSTRGWVDAPYLSCPAGAEELARNLVRLEGERAAIVPGVAVREEHRADIMRGEEVQIVGAAAAGMIPLSCTVCHPGTHNKWAVISNGGIARFRTVMTGEMFNLLRKGSILSELLGDEVHAGDAFEQGVRRGLEGDVLTAEIFAIRARVLLNRSAKEEAASFTSGLLIGADLRVGMAELEDEPLVLMGRPELTSLYAAALRLTGRESQIVDGEEAFLAGARRIVELMQ